MVTHNWREGELGLILRPLLDLILEIAHRASRERTHTQLSARNDGVLVYLHAHLTKRWRGSTHVLRRAFGMAGRVRTHVRR